MTESSTPVIGRVSVIMPCFNGAAYVAEAIESVLAQTHVDTELVIVDDGSTDESLNIIGKYKDRVRLIEQTNQGPSSARNTGIVEATGEYIAFLDSDDYWEPEFVEVMLAALQDANAVLAYCGWQNVDANKEGGQPFIPPNYEAEDKRVALLKNASLWPIHAMLTRRSSLNEIGRFNAGIRMCEDYELWLRLTFSQPIIHVPEVLSYYRHHKVLVDSDKRARDAEHLRSIKQNFVRLNEHLVSDIPQEILDDCINGGFVRRGYQCYWNRELLSARRIFRKAFMHRAVSVKDLKYVFLSFLPLRIHLALIKIRGADLNEA